MQKHVTTDRASRTAALIPNNITVHQQSRILELLYEDGTAFNLPFEFLRVYSPSAEVQGHAPGQETLQIGKRDVQITAIEPIGNYAIQPQFSDGHDSGIFTWHYLHWLGTSQDMLWEKYLMRLAEAGYTEESGREALIPENST